MNHEKQPVEIAQPAPVPPATPTPPVASTPSNGLAIASLVVGIFAFITSWVPLLSIIAGAVAIILGCLALKRLGGKGLAIAGISTGGAGALFGLFTSFFAVIAFIGFAGLADTVQREADNSRNNSSQNDNTNVPSSLKTSFKSGETGIFGDIEVKINSVKRKTAVTSIDRKPSADKEFVTINVSVTNKADTSKFFGTTTLRVNDGTTTVRPIYVPENSKLSGLLEPGEALTIDLTYEVEEGADNLTLEMTGSAGTGVDYYGQVKYSLEF